MNRHRRLGIAALAYLLVTLVPLFVILLGPVAPERGFSIELGVAFGFIGLAMLGLQSVLTARYPRVSSALGQDALLQFHRQTGLVAFGFVLAHPVILLLADGSNWAFLDPRDNFLRAVFLVFVLLALPAIVVTSLWREQLRLPYEWWRLAHGALAVTIVLVGLVHITRVRYYLESGWKQALWLAIGTASIASVLYARALKPLRVGRHPYRVVSVESVADRTWTVTVAPQGAHRIRFRAGQFAFLTIAETPFSLDQHPFSIASSARRTAELQFAIKELGDFTRSIGTIPTGASAFVDGPYGSMRLPDVDGGGLVLVAGGIGITPIVSMLRTMRDERSTVPVLLVYANERLEGIAFRDELDEMARELDLQVVHVLADPPPGWTGEAGFVTAELVAKYVERSSAPSRRYVLCGPPPMMEAVERALLDLGVPLDRVESERFDIGAAGEVGRRGVQIRRLVVGLSTVMVAAAALFAW